LKFGNNYVHFASVLPGLEIINSLSFIIKNVLLSFVCFYFDTDDIPKILSQEPLILLNKSTLQRPVGPVLHLEVSSPQGTDLQLDVSTLHRHVLLLEMSTPQGPELHLDMSTLKRPVLLLELSTPLTSGRIYIIEASAAWLCFYTTRFRSASGGYRDAATFRC
jgi:hypothetical protein